MPRRASRSPPRRSPSAPNLNDLHSEWPTPPKHIFLTGPPEIGKSTIIDSVRARLAAGVEMPGFITKELRDAAGDRIGFRSHDWISNDSVQIATLERGRTRRSQAAAPAAGPMVGPFRVHVQAMEEFYKRQNYNPWFWSDHSRSDWRFLTIMDEVGAMQLLSPRILDRFKTWLAASHCLGTIPPPGLHNNLPFVEHIRQRSDTLVLSVTRENRDSLPDVVCSFLYRSLYGEERAKLIEPKVALAHRYVKELDRRLTEGPRDTLDFEGDHGVYKLTPKFYQDASCAGRVPLWAVQRCTCPFFQEHQTCSHTLALAMSKEPANAVPDRPPPPPPPPSSSKAKLVGHAIIAMSGGPFAMIAIAFVASCLLLLVALPFLLLAAAARSLIVLDLDVPA